MAKRKKMAVKIIPGHFRNIKGVEALQRKIAALPEAAVAELAPVVRRSAERALRTLKRIAPVSDLENEAGELRDNYRIEPGDHELAWQIVGDAKDADGKPINKHVEHGHKAADGSKVAAVPHFYPAINLERPKFNSAASRGLTKAVKAVAAKSGGDDE